MMISAAAATLVAIIKSHHYLQISAEVEIDVMIFDETRAIQLGANTFDGSPSTATSSTGKDQEQEKIVASSLVSH